MMTVLGELVTGGITGILDSFGNAVARFKADPTQVAQFDAELEQAKQQLLQMGLQADQAIAIAQAKINEIEAASLSKFAAWWRPAIGWVCASAYAYTFVLQPLLIFLITALQIPLKQDQLPNIPVSEMSVVLMGMLGLGVMRTYEKTKGVTQ